MTRVSSSDEGLPTGADSAATTAFSSASAQFFVRRFVVV
jgi:hypothetical protein